jgi:hypothetical protein
MSGCYYILGGGGKGFPASSMQADPYSFSGRLSAPPAISAALRGRSHLWDVRPRGIVAQALDAVLNGDPRVHRPEKPYRDRSGRTWWVTELGGGRRVRVMKERRSNTADDIRRRAVGRAVTRAEYVLLVVATWWWAEHRLFSTPVKVIARTPNAAAYYAAQVRRRSWRGAARSAKKRDPERWMPVTPIPSFDVAAQEESMRVAVANAIRKVDRILGRPGRGWGRLSIR